MTGKLVCSDCQKEFEQDQVYIDHILEEHSTRVHSYLIKHSLTNDCPGHCGRTYLAEELTR